MEVFTTLLTDALLKMTYQISQPYYATPDNSVVNCFWDHPLYGVIPFSASLRDSVEYGPTIFENCVNGLYGPVVSYEDSHWYSLTDANEWQGKTYRIGEIMISPLGVQPPNSTHQPIPSPPLK